MTRVQLHSVFVRCDRCNKKLDDDGGPAWRTWCVFAWDRVTFDDTPPGGDLYHLCPECRHTIVLALGFNPNPTRF